MKKSILPIGLLTSMSFIVGLVFKTLHLPGANMMMYGGLLFFCCLYAPLWLFNRVKTESMTSFEKLRWNIGVLSGVVFATGNLFKVSHFPGANIMIMVGGLLFALLYLPATFYGIYQKESCS